MAHEGYYSESSNLGNVNDLLDEAELYRDQANASALSAATSETNAAASAATAVSSASDASASASAAAASATNSGNSATNSANSATAAATSATNAASSASAAAASAASIDPASLLTKAGNLSGLADKAISRENLGIFNFAKNKIINGDCRVAQRPSTLITNATFQYGQCDRYFANLSATTVTQGSIIQDTAAPSLAKSGFVAGVTGATTTGPTSGGLGQRIEAANTKDLSGATVTISCKVQHDLAANTNWFIQVAKANTPDNFSATTGIQTSSNTVVPANTPTTLTFTLTLSAADVLNGLQVFVGFSGVTTLSNKGFYLSELQLEVGSVATPFEHRPIGQELALCQRYYEVVNSYGFTLDATPGPSQLNNSVGWVRTFEYKVQKRADPSLTFSYASTGMVPPPGIAGDANYAMLGKGGLFSINTETGSNPYIYTVVITASAEL